YVLRWPLLLVFAMGGLALLYRFGPDRPQPPLRWLSWAAGTAAAVWVVASVAFSWFVARFGAFNQVYGTLGAAVVLMLWLLLSAFVVLLGAELDAALERQTRQRRPAPR